MVGFFKICPKINHPKQMKYNALNHYKYSFDGNKVKSRFLGYLLSICISIFVNLEGEKE
jgi:hypothetical protein